MAKQQPSNRKKPLQKKGVKSAVPAGVPKTPSMARMLGMFLQAEASALPRKLRYLFVFLLFIVGFLLYSNTITHDYALDDDLVYKLNTSVKKGVAGIPEIWRTTNMFGFNQQNFGAYRPLTQSIFALEYEIFGLNPHAQHAISALLFALTSALLFILLLRMLKSYPLWVPLGAALIFAAHPIHTEVVANIKSSDEMISFLFGLVLCFYFLFRYIDTRKPLALILSLIFFTAGLFSKEHIITLLPIIPLTLYFFTEEKLRRIGIITLWFLIPVALYLFPRMAFVENADDKIVFLDNFIWHIPGFSEKAGTILYVLLQYLRLVFVPIPLSCDYSWAQTPELPLFSFWPLISLLLYTGLGLFAIWKFRKKNILSWCILFFLASISIYSHVYAGLACTMAERFLFLPSLAVVIALLVLLYRGTTKLKNLTTGSRLILWPLLLVFLLFSIKTISRNTVWKNSDTLFMNDVTHAPGSARLNKSAGDVFINKGKDEKNPAKKEEMMHHALDYLMKAYDIYADYPDNLLDIGTAWFYLGEYDSAWVYWKRHAEIQSWSPRVKENLNYMKSGWFVKGQELSKEGRGQEAVQAFQEALRYDSLFSPAWFNMGLVYADLRDYEKATSYMQKALLLDSLNADFWYNYGGLMFTLNRRDEARLAWEKTLRLKPGYPDAIQGLSALGTETAKK